MESGGSRGRRAITRWNVTALVVFALGGAFTILAGQLALLAWARTGDRLVVGGEQHIQLDYGRHVIFYESQESVPSGNMPLTLRDPYGRRVRPDVPAEIEEYRLWLGGHSGRALWELNVIEPGLYSILASSANHASDADVPAGDRLVFNKRPPTLGEAELWRKVIQITLASLTFALTVACYLLHARALRRIV